MRYFSNKFSKIAKLWSALCAPLPFDIGDLKMRDLAKLWCFKLIMAKLNFWKNQLWCHFSRRTKRLLVSYYWSQTSQTNAL